MRDRTRFALKQAVTIFLLVSTLAIKVVPEELFDGARNTLMAGVCTFASPLYFLSGLVLKTPAAAVSSGGSREELARQVDELTGQLVARESELRKVRQELEAIKGFKTTPLSEAYLASSGDLIGYIRGGDASVFSRSYYLNLGARHGVEKGAPVVWGKYAVGVVSSVSGSYSRVRVLGDPRSRAAVRFVRSRYQGVLVGSARQACPVRFVPNPARDDEIQVGDYVVTSGADKVFPANLVVGRVSRFFKRASEPSADVEVELAVDFNRIENCLVLKKKPAIPEE
jgi:cell shape-determining protein MreC